MCSHSSLCFFYYLIYFFWFPLFNGAIFFGSYMWQKVGLNDVGFQDKFRGIVNGIGSYI